MDTLESYKKSILERMQHRISSSESTDDILSELYTNLNTACHESDNAMEHTVRFTLGKTLLLLDRKSDAESTFLELLEIVKKRNDITMIVETLLQLAYLSNPVEQTFYFQQAIDYTPLPLVKASCYVYLGNTYLKISASDKAIEQYTLAMQLLESCTDTEQQTQEYVHKHIGLLFAFIQVYTWAKAISKVFDLCDAVEEFLENNQPLISQKRLEISYIKLYISRGTAFGLEKKYDLAIKEYLRITKKYPPHVRFANYEHVHFNIASLYIELQDTALAVITLHSLSPT